MTLSIILVLLTMADQPTEVTVGMSGRVEKITLPGTELEAKPYTDRKTPVFVWVRSAKPMGTDYEYTLEFQGYDPGSYDLRQYLRRKDGSSTQNLPAIPIKVNALRPPGQVEPNALQMDDSFGVGGYRWWLLLGALAWLFGLVCIIYYGFWPKRKTAELIATKPVTLADRLRPLVEHAVAGKAAPEELATLERCLLTWWRRKLRIEQQANHESSQTLRTHSEAGPLLQQLELWLHRPGTRDQVDVARLLAPYQKVAADALDNIGGKA
jgi:hypothetical protein